MEPINLFAREIFKTYRTRAEKDASVYVHLRIMAPYFDFPRYKRALERHAILAEMWGTIATKLSGGKVDYLRAWAKGDHPYA